MIIGGRSYTRQEILKRVGTIHQLGGTRHVVLDDGWAKGTAAIEFNTGSGFLFTVVPDRGMDISAASYKGVNLVYRTPYGEVHPAYYEPQGRGWLRTFFGGLLTTCGLTYLGPPCRDGVEDLGLHGRYSTIPAAQVRDGSRWEGDEYRMEVTGTVEECMFFGDKMRMTRTISALLGSKALTLYDVVGNFGYRPAPFTVLYHINAGFPLLDVGSELLLTADECVPIDSVSAENAAGRYRFSPPLVEAREQNFLYRMRSDDEGWAYVALANRLLNGGVALYVRFHARTLPYLNEWKMMGAGEYVVGLEPSNSIGDCRAVLRERGELPSLEPGSSCEMRLEIGVLDGPNEIDAFADHVAKVMGRPEGKRPDPPLDQP